MNEEEFKRRTKALGLQVIRLVEGLPRGRTGEVIARQLLRSATSVGANYRAACRAKSNADMIHKLTIVEEEGDETMYWLELLGEAGLLPPTQLAPLTQEANEIVAMTVASIRTLRKKQRPSRSNPKSPLQNRK